MNGTRALITWIDLDATGKILSILKKGKEGIRGIAVFPVHRNRGSSAPVSIGSFPLIWGAARGFKAASQTAAPLLPKRQGPRLMGGWDIDFFLFFLLRFPLQPAGVLLRVEKMRCVLLLAAMCPIFVTLLVGLNALSLTDSRPDHAERELRGQWDGFRFAWSAVILNEMLHFFGGGVNLKTPRFYVWCVGMKAASSSDKAPLQESQSFVKFFFPHLHLGSVATFLSNQKVLRFSKFRNFMGYCRRWRKKGVVCRCTLRYSWWSEELESQLLHLDQPSIIRDVAVRWINVHNRKKRNFEKVFVDKTACYHTYIFRHWNSWSTDVLFVFWSFSKQRFTRNNILTYYEALTLLWQNGHS